MATARILHRRLNAAIQHLSMDRMMEVTFNWWKWAVRAQPPGLNELATRSR